MPATTSEALAIVNRTVLISPMVLLSVVDHFGRSADGTGRRVVGALLGHNEGNQIRVTNSFAVPFAEDNKSEPFVYFLDHDYVDSMSEMTKKINAKEQLIGWYHSGPKLYDSDMRINEIFKRYTPDPLLVIIDVKPKHEGIPTDAYFAVEEIRDDGTGANYTFVHTPSVVHAEEAEEIGVEHLLRDIRDIAAGSLSSRMTSQVKSLQLLHSSLNDIDKYLTKVLSGEYPINRVILGVLQDIFNLLPNLATGKLAVATAASMQSASASSATHQTKDNSELLQAMRVKNNDQMMMVFLSSLIRALTAFHGLINNKVENIQAQREREEEAENEAKKQVEVKNKSASEKEISGQSIEGASKEKAEK